MSDSYDDYECKIQLAEHAWEIKEARRQGASEVMRRSHSSKGKHMNTEEIIRMAREAGLAYGSDEKPLGSVTRFAALVAKHEREACAKVCDVLAVHPEYASDITKVAAQAIRARGKQ